MGLKLDGKPLNLKRETPALSMVRQFLERAPEDEVFTSANILAKLNISQFTLTRSMPQLAGFSLLHGRNRYWGSLKAIAALRDVVGK